MYRLKKRRHQAAFLVLWQKAQEPITDAAEMLIIPVASPLHRFHSFPQHQSIKRTNNQYSTMVHIFPSPENYWNTFLSSPDFQKVNSYYRNACRPGWTKPLPSKKCWHRSLSRACELWYMVQRCCETREEGQLEYWVHAGRGTSGIMMMGPSYAALLQYPLWRTLCFLMKGTYYIENGLSLNRLQEEDHDDFLLHAAIGSLLHCGPKRKKYDFLFQYYVRAVFNRVLELHGGDQIEQIGPVDDHIPLHVAAINPGLFHRKIKRLTNGIIIDGDRHTGEYFLTKVLEASPLSATTRLDKNKLTPLQLACLNGHKCGADLQQLTQGVSEGAKCSAGICLAIGTSRVSDSSTRRRRNPIKMGRNLIRKNFHQSYHGGVYFKTDEGHQESLNSVYKLLQADPSFLSHAIRDINSK